MHSHPMNPLKPRILGALALGLALASSGFAEVRATSSTPVQKEKTMTQHATGPFDVKVSPLPLAGPAEDTTLGRMSIEKQFHGDLEAIANGQMLTASTEVKGSGAYVAMERVSGKLQGRSGTFALQHRGVMTRGEPQLEVTVVPDSGTGELVGLAGTLHILIAEGGKHSYDFEYTLPEGK
jgi:hypothetical protein